MRRRALIAPALAALLLLTGCTEPGLQGTTDDTGVTEWKDPTTPVVFSGPTSDGSAFRSKDHLGDVLVVNFWYAGCAPCNAEAPVLQALATQYGEKGVQFVGVNIEDERANAQSFERRYKVPYPSILDQADGGATQLAFHETVKPALVPSTLVLDGKGRVRARIIGQADRSVLNTLIEEAVDGKGA